MEPRRGDVWWVSFDPSVGGEIQKTRPAVILSNDAANIALNRVIVVPISSKTAKLYPSETLITLNGQYQKAMADQVMTASKKRLRSKLGRLSAGDIASVENVLLLQLGIWR